MRVTRILWTVVALGGLVAAPSSANAGLFKYTTINVPGALPGETAEFGIGINNLGQIVGDFFDGFLETDGRFTTINAPGVASGTELYGINDLGQIVGYGSHAFLDSRGKFTDIEVPLAFAGSTT